MDPSTHNRRILESIFGGGAFQPPAFEYELRSENFVAEIPQSGERFESRDALREMQENFGASPRVQLKEIRGEGDIWVVEAVLTYEEDGDVHICAIVEFEDGKITRETRYYGEPIASPRE